MRTGWLGAIGVAACVAAVGGAAAQQRTITTAATMRVGEVRQLMVLGAHRSDCVTSEAPLRIEVVQAPRLGVISERPGVPYVARESLSGTCAGARLLGTAVDYAARAPGSDSVTLDAVFRNGTARRVVTITVAP